ncbi:NAD(P)-binding protein [Atractiella rhizophila]|nr:NAD(P)-binding protein [Atractiella rhizophila]
MPRVFVITGTARGMGLEWVVQLSKNPSNTVFALARKPSSELVSLGFKSPNVHVVVGDISDATSIKAAVAEVASKTERVDVLINNAAIRTEGGKPTPFIELPIEQFEQAFRVNVIGTIQTTNAFLPLLRMGEKKVVNVNTVAGSIAAVDPDKDLLWKNIGFFGAYSVSKAALNMATRKYDANLRHEGFTFIALHPGWVKTEMGKLGGGDNPVESDYTTEMSVRDCLAIIEKVTPDTAHKFYAVDTEDKTLPW